MMPDSPETRLLRLEREIAMLSQKLQDFQERIADLFPMMRHVIELQTQVKSLEEDVETVTAVCNRIRTSLEDRDREATQERRSVRAALIGLTGAILAAIIAAVTTLLASGAHP
jgi:chromosome segregation ATPase